MITQTTRCKKSTINLDKIHCEEHYEEGTRLYKKYKKICKLANGFVDLKNNNKVVFLNKWYAILVRAYDARMAHRQKFIAPDCRDHGHDQQFIMLKEQICECEHQLELIYADMQKPQNNPEILNVTKQDVSIDDDDVSFIEDVKTFKKQRLDEEKKLNLDIAAYLKENAAIAKEKKDNIDFCAHVFRKYLCQPIKFEYPHMLCMFVMVNEFQQFIRQESCAHACAIFDLQIKDVERYSSLEERMNELVPEYLACLVRELFVNKGFIVRMLLTIQKTWQNTNFDPLCCTFQFMLNDTSCLFEILQTKPKMLSQLNRRFNKKH